MNQNLPDATSLRFTTPEHLRRMTYIPLPALVLPLGIQAGPNGSWVFESSDGPLPAPDPDVFDEMLRQIAGTGLTWRFVPYLQGSTLLSVCIAPDSNKLVTGEDDNPHPIDRLVVWLIANEWPFDRLSA